MRIECPACGAEYEVPEERLAPGLLVRCVRCKNDWSPPPPEPPPAALPEPEPEPPPEVAPKLAPEPPIPDRSADRAAPPPADIDEPRPRLRLHERVPLLALAWVFSIVVLTGLAYAAMAGRDGVMRAWPASARAYHALGLRSRSGLAAHSAAHTAAEAEPAKPAAH